MAVSIESYAEKLRDPNSPESKKLYAILNAERDLTNFIDNKLFIQSCRALLRDRKEEELEKLTEASRVKSREEFLERSAKEAPAKSIEELYTEKAAVDKLVKEYAYDKKSLSKTWDDCKQTEINICADLIMKGLEGHDNAPSKEALKEALKTDSPIDIISKTGGTFLDHIKESDAPPAKKQLHIHEQARQMENKAHFLAEFKTLNLCLKKKKDEDKAIDDSPHDFLQRLRGAEKLVENVAHAIEHAAESVGHTLVELTEKVIGHHVFSQESEQLAEKIEHKKAELQHQEESSFRPGRR